MFTLGNHLVKKALGHLKIEIECESPLEIRQEESFATNKFAEEFIDQKIKEAIENVFDIQMKECIRGVDGKKITDFMNLLQMSNTEYNYFLKTTNLIGQREVNHSSLLSDSQQEALLVEFNENPEKYTDPF